MVEVLMMLTLLVVVLSQLLPEDDENEPQAGGQSTPHRFHTWRAPQRVPIERIGSAEAIAYHRR